MGSRDGWMWKMPSTSLRFTIVRHKKDKKGRRRVYVYLYMHGSGYHEVCLWNFKGGDGYFKRPKDAKRFVASFAQAINP